MVREAVSNTVRHAHATALRITVTTGVCGLVIDVTDDGVGIPSVQTGSGLQDLADRAVAGGGGTISQPADGGESIDAAAVRDAGDVWVMLARARADGSPRAVAAAQGVVFRRFLPMARAVAAGAVPAGGSVDPGAAERAAESGLARVVAGWRSADGAGFDVSASITIAVELDRLSAAASDGDR